MRGRSLVTVVAITTATLGVTAGIAYAALPNTSTGIVRSAAPAYNLVLGPQVGGTSHRHVAQAKCGGAPVVSGGYDLQGGLGAGGYGFNTARSASTEGGSWSHRRAFLDAQGWVEEPTTYGR